MRYRTNQEFGLFTVFSVLDIVYIYGCDEKKKKIKYFNFYDKLYQPFFVQMQL